MSLASTEPFYYEHPGFCPACERNALFVAKGPYFRSTLRCSNCNSAPRNRAVMNALTTYFPKWRQLALHESSPGNDIVSTRLANECADYTASQFRLGIDPGT